MDKARVRLLAHANHKDVGPEPDPRRTSQPAAAGGPIGSDQTACRDSLCCVAKQFIFLNCLIQPVSSSEIREWVAEISLAK